MRTLGLVATGIACVAAAEPVAAQQRVEFDIPAGRLDSALLRFARQAGLSIDTSDPVLRRVRSPAVKGRFTRSEALRRLLRGTRYEFRIDRQVVTLILPPRPSRQSPRVAQQPAPHEYPLPPPPQPIVVTATKQESRLSDYPGAIHVAELGPADGLRFGSGGSSVILRELPNLTSTDLGEGRNKIFIRGVADSSFNGQTQATISQYLGESRLNYSGPDPDLMLYDIARFEVLEGPQGTLYGAGSLGGVIQMTPRSPELDATTFAGVAAMTLTDSEIGGEVAAIGNLPVADNAAARLVAYRVHRPGYIDDPGRGLEGINRTDIAGARASLRILPSDRFDIELGFVAQDLSAEDGQYTDSGTDALTRNSAIAQPFDSNYLLGYATVHGELGFADLTSTTSAAFQAVDSVFDATPAGAATPLAYVEDRNISLIAHETRLSGSFGPVSSWVGGVALTYNHDRAARFFGDAASPAEVSQVLSVTTDTAVFGEATLGPWHNFSITGGGRLSWVQQTDEIELAGAPAEIEPRHSSVRVLPSAALSWTPGDGVIVYARYREGYRPGAAQVVGSGANASATRFEADDIGTSEIGLRFGTQPGARLWGGASISYSRWDEIQADLVSQDGFPMVANLGSGFVRYGSIGLGWRPIDALTLKASGFMTTAHLDRPSPEFLDLEEADLPNIADSGWHFSARLDQNVGAAKLSVTGSAAYIGESYLGVGSALELPQGKYIDANLGARIEWEGWGLSLDVDNLLDERENRFSYGNPFTVTDGMQRTPLRPRTLRIGIDAQF